MREVKRICRRDAATGDCFGEGHAVALVGESNAEIELMANLKVHEHQKSEGCPAKYGGRDPQDILLRQAACSGTTRPK